MKIAALRLNDQANDRARAEIEHFPPQQVFVHDGVKYE
jgi:hypothetical protein